MFFFSSKLLFKPCNSLLHWTIATIHWPSSFPTILYSRIV
nr:MAG TPA: hypothetical protein [Caudoviricetes sp.]